MSALALRVATSLVLVPVLLVGGAATAEHLPPMPPLGDVDTTTPPPGAPTTDDIGLPPPPPPDLGGELPPPLPEPPPEVEPEPDPEPLEPCHVDGGSLLLRMNPAYAKITPTGSVTLSARLLQDGRQCQAGLPVRIYARGPGGTVFHLSRTLTTDSGGLVRTTYVRPRGDFRWYAKSVTELGMAQSSTGLVQVR